MDWTAENPAPGSDAALDLGCRCPVLDNAHGKGRYALGKDWWISENCPLHGRRPADVLGSE